MHYGKHAIDIVYKNQFFLCFTGQEMATKREKMKSVLTKIAPFLQNREHPIQNQYLRSLFAAVHDLFVRLQKSIEEIHHPEGLKDSKILEKSCHESGKAESLNEPISNGSFNPISAIMNSDGQHREPPHWTSSESTSTEPPRPEFFRARGMPSGVSPGVAVETYESRDIYTARLEDLRDVHPSLGFNPRENESTSQPAPAHIDMEWSSTILKSSIFEADPFWLLIVFLSVSLFLFEFFVDVVFLFL